MVEQQCSEAKGLCSNPLIHFTVIKGLAVGLFIRYPMITHLIKGGPLLNHPYRIET